MALSFNSCLVILFLPLHLVFFHASFLFLFLFLFQFRVFFFCFSFPARLPSIGSFLACVCLPWLCICFLTKVQRSSVTPTALALISCPNRQSLRLALAAWQRRTHEAVVARKRLADGTKMRRNRCLFAGMRGLERAAVEAKRWRKQAEVTLAVSDRCEGCNACCFLCVFIFFFNACTSAKVIQR